MSPIAMTLGRVTEELRKVAVRLDKVQDAVSDLVLTASPRAARLHDLQDIDRATQEISAIAAFLEKLSSDLPNEWLADPKGASRIVDLHELAVVLGHLETGEPVAGHGASQECEMFD